MQPITAEFVYTQLRIAFIAGVAYAGGAGFFSPTETTFALALITSLLPLIVPWIFSTYASWGSTKVLLGSVAAQVAVSERRMAENGFTPAESKVVLQAVVRAWPLENIKS